jgi:hypothetical protein
MMGLPSFDKLRMIMVSLSNHDHPPVELLRMVHQRRWQEG